MAGHVRLELRNVVAKYPFERSLRFPGIQQNSDHRDYSPLSCGVGWTRIGIILHDCGGKRRASWRALPARAGRQLPHQRTKKSSSPMADNIVIRHRMLELPDALCSCKRQRVASAKSFLGR